MKADILKDLYSRALVEITLRYGYDYLDSKVDFDPAGSYTVSFMSRDICKDKSKNINTQIIECHVSRFKHFIAEKYNVKINSKNKILSKEPIERTSKDKEFTKCIEKYINQCGWTSMEMY